MNAFSILLSLAMVAQAGEVPLTNLSGLELKNANTEQIVYRGSKALKITEKENGPGEALAIIKDGSFHNGSIDVDVAGAPSKTAGDQARGFIGISFRIQADGTKRETIYIRPANGRVPDQLRRNHSTQYVSVPDWPWERLRKESPGVYESYADMESGEWTHLRIVVNGKNASLYVGGATQPCLVIGDLKLGDSQGRVALWVGPGTEAHFRNLKIEPAP